MPIDGGAPQSANDAPDAARILPGEDAESVMLNLVYLAGSGRRFSCRRCFQEIDSTIILSDVFAAVARRSPDPCRGSFSSSRGADGGTAAACMPMAPPHALDGVMGPALSGQLMWLSSDR